MTWNREDIARRAAAELRDGDYVNLGIGIPTLVPEYLPSDIDVIIHCENGILGVGTHPTLEEYDPDIINAAKHTVAARDGAAFFDSSASFAMIRGGHLDFAILGAMEVSAHGDLANWVVPGKLVKGMGGAMDLAVGAQRVLVLMSHVSKDGTPKLKTECSLPLTGPRVVDRIITDLAVIDVTDNGFLVIDLADGVDPQTVIDATGAPVAFAPELAEKASSVRQSDIRIPQKQI
ncbi:3-oxoacid CoA-transferase, B subunit [Mycolicibacterium aurum]|uniref:3-oxoacid CoA-transferase, B subunit n=1 Tax=Mycolicibacterium aurum TaxID=1791 RepID=A0A3S4VJA1_MYCAU|nr:3-oxoacid CoA-transferase subunit B [Mycolicibacterium aurum]VEG52647.1 3-oxoacid CoA-transferase, B subunit [Mycolicibacterium aurum]